MSSNLEKYLNFKPYKIKKGEDYMSAPKLNTLKYITFMEENAHGGS